MAFRIWRKYDKKEVKIKSVDDYIASGSSRNEAIKKHEDDVKKRIYSTARLRWLDQSFAMYYIEIKCRNIKISHYKLSNNDKIKLLRNPSLLLDMPRDYIPKIDKLLSSDDFDCLLRSEFAERYDAGDSCVLDAINQSGTFTAIRNGTTQDDIKIDAIKEKYIAIAKNMLLRTEKPI